MAPPFFSDSYLDRFVGEGEYGGSARWIGFQLLGFPFGIGFGSVQSASSLHRGNDGFGEGLGKMIVFGDGLRSMIAFAFPCSWSACMCTASSSSLTWRIHCAALRVVTRYWLVS